MGRNYAGGNRGGRHSWRDVLNGEGSGIKPIDKNETWEECESNANNEDFYNYFSLQTLEPHQIEEILTLGASDHLGMMLMSAQLTGSNFLNWCRFLRRALAAQSKLELIDGTLPKLSPNISYYKQWVRTDVMISFWIINSISKELSSGFTHILSTRKLWEALLHRFGRCNGPRIFKL